MTSFSSIRNRRDKCRKYRCPRPQCRRIFYAHRSVSQHLRAGQCHEWYLSAGLDFDEDFSSSDGLTDRDEAEAAGSYCLPRSRSVATTRLGSEARTGIPVEPRMTDGYNEYHPRPSSTFGRGRSIFDLRARAIALHGSIRFLPWHKLLPDPHKFPQCLRV